MDLGLQPAVVAVEEFQRFGDAAAGWQAELDDPLDAVGAQADGAGGGMADGDEGQGAASNGDGRGERAFAEEAQSSPSMM